MNIFEFISSDSTGNSSSYLGISHAQRNWGQFRELSQQILSEADPSNLIDRGKYLWEEISRNSP